eukprot:1400590-Ditylum_brightwellii.AAC.1
MPPPSYPTLSQGGYHLYEHILSNEFTLIEIKKINYYREYLGVTILADITLEDGCTLDPHMKS